MPWQDVITGAKRWSCETADVLDFLRSVPDDSIDLLFTSPPYELARTYGIASRMVGGEAWVKWMVDIVTAARPKVKGLIAVNCEGQTRGYRYSCVPFLLMADLHRAGFVLRKPAVFRRVGIPGSGGPDWLRNDWEPVVCCTRRGKLPWSDNTACGHPPVYSAGGPMSNRLTDGRRVKGAEAGRMGRLGTKDGLPDIANPGNVVNRTYTAEEVADLMGVPADVIDCTVGGGQMGHDIAHENEAPFPLELAEFFVKSFCPPDGIVCDPFSGSGTTCHAAFLHGRRFVGCDVRDSQVELCGQRIETVTPDLFANVTEEEPTR